MPIDRMKRESEPSTTSVSPNIESSHKNTNNVIIVLCVVTLFQNTIYRQNDLLDTLNTFVNLWFVDVKSTAVMWNEFRSYTHAHLHACFVEYQEVIC